MSQDVDVAVVGAGFSGLYLLHRLRQAGFSAVGLETGDDVGGTWYWNRYPGARCDVPTTDYTFSFDPALEDAWTWSEKYATQPEILRYLGFVADRYDLRRDIRFATTVTAARWDDAVQRWQLDTSNGPSVSCRFYVMASGCLSAPKPPEIDGAKDFAGQTYLTSRWPHAGVDFTGMRVAVIGTGSSGIQSIPLIAQQAAHLTVFQRTPNFSLPALNGPAPAETVATLARDRAGYREKARWTPVGLLRQRPTEFSWQLSETERRERFERGWNSGELGGFSTAWADATNDVDGNALISEMIRGKIREIVDDPATAEALCPHDHPFGAKRPCLDTGYYATYNRPNVKLVDLRREPITTITRSAIRTAKADYDVDAIVFATGFDAMTGAMLAVHPMAGRDGVTLADAWADGPRTYLGLTIAGFPNLFLVTGPGSPSVLANMAVAIEQHVDWIVDRLIGMRDAGFTTIEATETAQAGWLRHAVDCTALTLHRLANTWYTGANMRGKARGVMPYTGGLGAYRGICDEVARRDMLGFRLGDANGKATCSDGEVVRLQPDVRLLLAEMAKLNLPAMESLGADGARDFVIQARASRPAVRPVGAVVDGTLPGAGGPLRYRLYRPATPGPHAVLVYFHGGGWVLGSHDSDDPLCRDLCRRSDMLVISVDYRHAPEHRFPAAAEDGYAAMCWIARNTADIGGRPGPVVVAGFSAGGNVAAVVCQLVRDRGGAEIAGQLLLCPVTDHDFTRSSYNENAQGYHLTKAMMHWFWDLYCSPAERNDPRASPLRGQLAGLPPALVVTCEFDPLRDEGIAYAEALAAAGVKVSQLQARGHIHTSLAMVDVIITSVGPREQMAQAVRGFAGLTGAKGDGAGYRAAPRRGPTQEGREHVSARQ
ncbi:alpha/beta hydrolase fold domain-containing protein [Reyranella sp. CPCC 100927]|uniref:flavin-containing monooxygenase n=1 Tax=Reyranella sp. CPCC 100927 TaxID=2599616 RepID=UPI0011B56FEC|nr:alpha/beta hydrolase fold domain-containing protein [Reyranella sp. CPCC 100927]TWS93902.1 carboxylesterase family protein [Reyranella sp. CPCC 100927]